MRRINESTFYELANQVPVLVEVEVIRKEPPGRKFCARRITTITTCALREDGFSSSDWTEGKTEKEAIGSLIIDIG